MLLIVSEISSPIWTRMREWGQPRRFDLSFPSISVLLLILIPERDLETLGILKYPLQTSLWTRNLTSLRLYTTSIFRHQHILSTCFLDSLHLLSSPNILPSATNLWGKWYRLLICFVFDRSGSLPTIWNSDYLHEESSRAASYLILLDRLSSISSSFPL